jgi:hypothetical protein
MEPGLVEEVELEKSQQVGRSHLDMKNGSWVGIEMVANLEVECASLGGRLAIVVGMKAEAEPDHSARNGNLQVGADRVALVEEVGSQEAEHKGFDVTTNSTLSGCAPLDAAGQGCCMVTGWAVEVLATHLYAYHAPRSMPHGPAIPDVLVEYMMERHLTMQSRGLPRASLGHNQ